MQISPLKRGDKVAITCTASPLSLEAIQSALETLKKWGLEVIVGETVGAKYLDFAGTDRLRIDEFQDFLEDDSIKAIFCGRGGYGTARIIDFISFENFVRNPKWIIGYSDVTTLHSHIQENFQIPTVHSVMLSGFDSSLAEATNTLKAILFGKPMRYHFKSNSLNQNGTAEGVLVGGNLSILQSMLGSRSQMNTDNKILFLEDVGEKVYNIDRMMVSLKRAGMLTNLKGLLVGGFTGMKKQEEFGKSAEEVVLEHCKNFGYPIALNFPAGHQKNNRALLFGVNATLTVEENCFLDFR